ncbi:MAG: hypothetical protein JSU66_16195 [Deltaproteobacteria bacterium]|nr:MAG: hypothetical protein JSU66_16195 [Deltaproteobacteria bacterium]
MTIDFLDERRKALEEAFFRKENARLLENLREKRHDEEKRTSLSRASGIEDRALLDALVHEGLQAESLAAITLVPLVFTAWGDGKLEPPERFAILSAADASGIARGSASFELLESWLRDRPHHTLFRAWVQYVHVLCERLRDDDRKALRDNVLHRAREVAKAAGGVLGLGPKIAPGQQAVLDKLADAFSGGGASAGA